MSHQGKAVKELAEIFSVIPLTIYNWLYRWENKGLVGMLNEKGVGRKAILSESDRDVIKQKVQQNHQKLSLARDELKAALNKEFSEKTLKRFFRKLWCPLQTLRFPAGKKMLKGQARRPAASSQAAMLMRNH